MPFADAALNSKLKQRSVLTTCSDAGSGDFRKSTNSIQKPSWNPELLATDATPSTTSGLEMFGGAGAPPDLKCATLDLSSMQSPMPSVYDLSNALLLAAKLEVQHMMSQLAAQFAQSDQAASSYQAQSAASLPLPTLLPTPTLPGIIPAHLLLPSAPAFLSPVSSSLINDRLLANVSLGNDAFPTSVRSDLNSS